MPRTRERTSALRASETPETLWYDYGIVPDFEVCHYSIRMLTRNLVTNQSTSAVHHKIPSRRYTRTPYPRPPPPSHQGNVQGSSCRMDREVLENNAWILKGRGYP